MTDLTAFIQRMPKAELHVHLEGSVRPETLLKLARRHHVSLPADDVPGLQKWYTFRDFDHFVEIYMTISSCLRSAEDIELVAREFLIGQAEQNILHSEVTFTPFNQLFNCGLAFRPQMDAVRRAREWGMKELGTRLEVILDIPREHPAEVGDKVAEWVIECHGEGVVAMGLGGPERGNRPSKFRRAFERVREAGIPCILHAGETDGPQSVWNAINVAGTRRIGHGVRAIEDPALVGHLQKTQLTLEVCPTSNVCLGVFPSLQGHVLPILIEKGLKVTINSDDPPMFNTTLTGEYLACQRAYGWERERIEQLALTAVDESLLLPAERAALRQKFVAQCAALRP